jgi:hypothetical protein
MKKRDKKQSRKLQVYIKKLAAKLAEIEARITAKQQQWPRDTAARGNI